MPRKNAHAVALGRRGGSRKTPAQQRASAANGRLSPGRPPRYRLVEGEFQRRDGDRWLTLLMPYDAAAKAFLRRQP